MEITVHSSKTVKPDYSDGRRDGGAPATSSDVVPLSVFDKVSYDEYIAGVCAFHPPAPPNDALEAGLSKALAEYREWAGRLGVDASGNRAIVLDDAGARFVQATAGAELTSSCITQLTTGANLLSMYPSCDGADELLLVQVTRFRCGSIVVGVSMHHKVADGHAVWAFLFAWGQATRGVAIDPIPVHDRASLFAPRDPPQVMFDHRGNEFKPPGKEPESNSNNNVAGSGDEVEIHRVHFTREWISELKSQAPAGATTLQCLAAHLWRCITKARGLDGDEGATATKMRIAVNGRARMKSPPVPMGYTGNVVLWAWPATSARELVSQPLRDTVELICREVARTGDAYFRSFIDFMSSGVVEKEQLVPTADSSELTLSPNVEVDSLLGIPFYEMDFGGARPFFFLPGYSSLLVDGFIYIVQSFEGEGSVDAYMPLFSRTMDAFKKCCYSVSSSMAGERV